MTDRSNVLFGAKEAVKEYFRPGSGPPAVSLRTEHPPFSTGIGQDSTNCLYPYVGERDSPASALPLVHAILSHRSLPLVYADCQKVK